MVETIYDGSADPRTFKDALSVMIPKILDEDPDAIYLDADLMSCIGTAGYARAHPDRAINCGIAEANMAGIAAGLAASGFKPICHTFGTFASRRCFDQVFLSCGYAGNGITMIGTDPGVCAAMNGGTHMPFEDVALYRAIPGSTVLDPADTAQFDEVFPKLLAREGVKYVRVNRKSNDRIYRDGTKFEIGCGATLRQGDDAVVIAAGIMVGPALEAASALAARGIEAAVIDMFTIKPLDEELTAYWAKATGAVVVAENHNRVGGLCSAVADRLASVCPTPVGCVAVEESYGEVGPADWLAERFGLTAGHIVAEVERTIVRKQR
ncbi:MAG: transketolase family protein [Synergistaceae bacterium]|nr:transketolase family protein [Synergistaceae bacterium]